MRLHPQAHSLPITISDYLHIKNKLVMHGFVREHKYLVYNTPQPNCFDPEEKFRKENHKRTNCLFANFVLEDGLNGIDFHSTLILVVRALNLCAANDCLYTQPHWSPLTRTLEGQSWYQDMCCPQETNCSFLPSFFL